MNELDEGSARARLMLMGVQRLLRDSGLTFSDVGDVGFGVGISVPLHGDDFSVISVMASTGLCEVVNLAIGVLKDVEQGRLAVLDRCNELTRDNHAYPYFLHGTEAGWDILLQVRMPLGVAVAAPSYFVGLVRAAGMGAVRTVKATRGSTWAAVRPHRRGLRPPADPFAAASERPRCSKGLDRWLSLERLDRPGASASPGPCRLCIRNTS